MDIIELLDLNKHCPEEFEGKYILIEDIAYRIGKLCGEGGEKILHYLINEKTKTCHFLICIWIDQSRGRAYKDKKKIAEIIYGIDGTGKSCKNIMADFLYFPEFDDINNQYHCRFYVQELLGECAECSNPDAHIIFGHNSRKEFELSCNVCNEFLDTKNPCDDVILNLYAYAFINMCIQKRGGYQVEDIFKVRNILAKMISYEPFFKGNIYQAIVLFEKTRNYDLAVSVFERIKERVFEIYAEKNVMSSVVISLVKGGYPEDAERYIRYADSEIWSIRNIEAYKKRLLEYQNELNKLESFIRLHIENNTANDDLLNKKQEDFRLQQKHIANLYPYFWVSKLNLIAYAIRNNEPLDNDDDCLDLYILSDNEQEILYSQLHVGIYYLQRGIYVDNACKMLSGYMSSVVDKGLSLINTPLIVDYATFSLRAEITGQSIKKILECIMRSYENNHNVITILHELLIFFENRLDFDHK